MRHNPALDGLRAFAILAVLAHHYTYRLYGGGALGVDVFFALSGYLITTILVREVSARGRLNLGRFYARRVRRLAPALIASLVLTWALWPLLNPPGPFGAAALPAIFYYANWTAAFHEERLGVLSKLWSLSVEEQFYFVWPIALGLLLGRTLRLRRALVAVGGAIAALVVVRIVLHAGHSPFGGYFSTFARIDELLAGAWLALAQELHRGRLPFFGRRAGTAIAWTAAGFLVVSTAFVSPASNVLYWGGFTVVAWCAGVVFLHVENARDGRLARFLSTPFLVLTGKISYGLYLYHTALGEALEGLHARHSVANFIGLAALRTVLAFGVAWLSFRFLESPLVEPRRPAAAPAPG